MDKANRAKLLRERFRVVGGLPYVVSAVKRPPQKERGEPKPHFCPFPVSGTMKVSRLVEWVHIPNRKLIPIPRAKRMASTSALTKIAGRWASPTWREETKRLDLHHACR